MSLAQGNRVAAHFNHELHKRHEQGNDLLRGARKFFVPFVA